MLEVTDLHVSYGPIKAVRGINLSVKEGEIVSIIGANGAGKTSTLMSIAGGVRPASGRILFKGQDITGLPAHEVMKKGLVLVPEGRRIFSNLTVAENLELGAFTKKISASLIEELFEFFPVLKERRNQVAGTLSGGEQQMLAIARALMSEPELIMFDEPSLGLSPIMVTRIFSIIKKINSRGVTVLLVEQNAKAALKLSSRAYVLENGTLRMEGTGSELLKNEELRRAYLGE
ncbi:MAG: ABC transporter ATP-binding protein [Thermodesulfovibrionales bacterium]|nr:ABC transporter ATP-binding protein [Thermodesulfovibrionales bacterium]